MATLILNIATDLEIEDAISEDPLSGDGPGYAYRFTACYRPPVRRHIGNPRPRHGYNLRPRYRYQLRPRLPSPASSGRTRRATTRKVVKFGRSNDVYRRRREWRTQCKGERQAPIVVQRTFGATRAKCTLRLLPFSVPAMSRVLAAKGFIVITVEYPASFNNYQ
ncbi:hypothetical protein B0H10DRAFT_2230594 [Mycena sp. CBHHK59/15]|nr:hypothetical protein B0H10DRAFT_2230594 [Mycena sp. CBHHK59/15]